MLRYLTKPFSDTWKRTAKDSHQDAWHGMGKKSCAAQCGLSCLSTLCQGGIAVIFIALCFYLASLALTPVRILGITQLPPGIVYGHHDSRF